MSFINTKMYDTQTTNLKKIETLTVILISIKEKDKHNLYTHVHFALMSHYYDMITD